MSTKTKVKKSAPDNLDERMKRGLAAHDQWVADCEKQRRSEKPVPHPAPAKAVKKSPK